MAEIFLTQLAIKYFIFHLTQRLLCTTWGKQTKHNSVKINEKTSINSIYPNLWVPTAGLLQGLTVMRPWWSLEMFVKSRSDWYSLDWSGAEHYRHCCQWMEKASPYLCSHSGPTLQAILLQAVEKWTTGWNVSQTVRNVNKMCFTRYVN